MTASTVLPITSEMIEQLRTGVPAPLFPGYFLKTETRILRKRPKYDRLKRKPQQKGERGG